MRWQGSPPRGLVLRARQARWETYGLKLPADAIFSLLPSLPFLSLPFFPSLADATNSTRARRQALYDRIKREPGLKLLFIESVCTDPAVIAANIAVKVASGDPDYDGQPPEQAEKDFRERIKHYEESYETLDSEKDKEMTWCQMVNVGKQVRRESLPSSPPSSLFRLFVVGKRRRCR